MKALVEIFYKDSVFDPQGNTICQSLQRLGFRRVKDVRIGKVVQLELDTEGQSPSDAKKDVENMCEKLLANPVIESYTLQLEGK
ncbi:MAG: phosphoribosylformylglycinamidine synthase subunit PurS [Bdellovibrionales bacterium]|nr:phosphoribosylformylglycinamidine synthase subunit PurS [Bdellovibrionales bacterium]